MVEEASLESKLKKIKNNDLLDRTKHNDLINETYKKHVSI